MSQRLLPAALLALGILAAPSMGQDKATLKWKLEKDKPFYQKMNTKTVQTLKVMTNEVKQEQDQTFYFQWTPIKVEGDTVELKQKILGVVMNIDIAGQKISYDSTKTDPGTNPLADFFKQLIDTEFTITLNTKDMKVTKIEGRDAFLKKLGDANPAMKGVLDKILSEQALREMAEPTFGVAPGVEKAKGDKWTKKTNFDMGPIGKYENDYTFTYDGKADKLDRIKVENKMTYKPGDAAQGGLPFKIVAGNLTPSEAAGEVLWDAEKGRPSKSTMKLKLKGDLTIEINGQNTKVEIDQTQDTTIETMDEDPLKKK